MCGKACLSFVKDGSVNSSLGSCPCKLSFDIPETNPYELMLNIMECCGDQNLISVS